MNTQHTGIAPVVTATTPPVTTRPTNPAWRLFVAIPLPTAVRATAAVAQAALSAFDADVRWVRPEHMHLTLHFLGDTPQDDVAALITRLDATVARAGAAAGALALRTTGLGAFPTLRRPRVLWLGLDADGDDNALADLSTLANRVRAACGDTDQTSTFRPHITLGRVRQGRQIDAAALAAHASVLAVESVIWQADRIELLRSTLSASGSTYTCLHAWHLPTPDLTDHG